MRVVNFFIPFFIFLFFFFLFLLFSMFLLYYFLSLILSLYLFCFTASLSLSLDYFSLSLPFSLCHHRKQDSSPSHDPHLALLLCTTWSTWFPIFSPFSLRRVKLQFLRWWTFLFKWDSIFLLCCIRRLSPGLPIMCYTIKYWFFQWASLRPNLSPISIYFRAPNISSLSL